MKACPLAQRTPKPLLEERWHAQRDGEVCRPLGGGASAPSAQAETLRLTFGAVTPLSQPSADSSPQGEPFGLLLVQTGRGLSFGRWR